MPPNGAIPPLVLSFTQQCSEEKNDININFLGRIPDLGKSRFSGPKKFMLGLFYCKTQGIPNINFSEHELLAVARLAFQKVYAKKVYVVFSVPKCITR